MAYSVVDCAKFFAESKIYKTLDGITFSRSPRKIAPTSKDPRVLAPRVFEVSELIFLCAKCPSSDVECCHRQSPRVVICSGRSAGRFAVAIATEYRTAGGGRGCVTRALEIGRWCFTSCRVHERQLKQYHSTLAKEAVNESRISRHETFSIDDSRE